MLLDRQALSAFEVRAIKDVSYRTLIIDGGLDGQCRVTYGAFVQDHYLLTANKRVNHLTIQGSSCKEEQFFCR